MMDKKKSTNTGNQISFLFGAGAEADYGLPQGDAFATETLFDDNDNLLEALAEFYKHKENGINLSPKEWESTYQRRTTGFSEEIERKIIVKTVSALMRMNQDFINTHISSLRWLINQVFKQGEYDSLPVRVKQVLENNQWNPTIDEKPLGQMEVIPHWVRHPNAADAAHIELFVQIARNKSSYGILERYFHTVINPPKYGVQRFWRLVNYYWQVYFAVAIPFYRYLSHTGRNPEPRLHFEFNPVPAPNLELPAPTTADYLLYLNNIESITLGFRNAIENPLLPENNEHHYYGQEMVINSTGVITTNYTPIIHSFSPNQVAMINGGLKWFEFPYELAVFDFFSEDLMHPSHRLFFPFVFGMSSIKPIVHSTQVKEMTKMIEILGNSRVLVIIGYGLNEDDNHLNAHIREFLVDNSETQTHRVAYCHYCPQGFNADLLTVKENILDKLRINNPVYENVANRIKIIPNTGDTDALFAAIQNYVNEG